ncbi:LysR family transcriptional regulator [Ideonella sp. BN130291]|uniref:LysR family transcriptional regulator n=1 Tax=Ideonella sp. BN130291 TaxID=3112940 RepID=UPI002E26AE60|nr:LysR substrate-binding domain-containing protein [Ideonella sp. BN130291]
MDDFKRMAVFAAVVRQRSMSAAARQLGLSTSAVSQQIRRLERSGAVTLLHRSTRKLTLTDAGERFYAECAAMVEAAERAQHQLQASRDAPSGELRLSAPVGFARHVAPALGGLLAAHPALTLRLQVDDAHIDLIEARIDLAVRFGRLPDSTWVARRLCHFALWLCASPAYLREHGEPTTPQDLLSHHWLGFARERGPMLLQLGGPDAAAQVLRLEPRITSNNQLSLQQMCAAGLGLAVMGSLDVQDDLQAGRLVRVLPDWKVPPLDVWAVTPQRDAQPAKVRHAVTALHDYLLAQPGVE